MNENPLPARAADGWRPDMKCLPDGLENPAARAGYAFGEHLNAMAARTVVFTAEQVAQSAWDAALCAAQARCFDEYGQRRTAGEIMEVLSALHSWRTPEEDQS